MPSFCRTSICCLLPHGHKKAAAYLGLTPQFQIGNGGKVYRWRAYTSYEAKMQEYLQSSKLLGLVG